MIEFVVHDVDRTSTDRFAGSDHGFMHVMSVHALSAKPGKQGRVDIEHAAGEIGGIRNNCRKPARQISEARLARQ